MAVSGILEPAYAIGGDAFDYAVNGDTLETVVLDAMGHGVAAVVPAVVALAALRRARRRGLDLVDMYLEADRAVRDEVGGDAFVTAQLARLDVSSGAVSWVNAGHPCTLVVRDGQVSPVAACEPSLPLGLGGAVEEVGELSLQPWDRLVFFTDGVTAGRQSATEMFGEDRSHAVLDHHAHELRDDFTLVAVEYRGGAPGAGEGRLARRAAHDTSQ